MILPKKDIAKVSSQDSGIHTSFIWETETSLTHCAVILIRHESQTYVFIVCISFAGGSREKKQNKKRQEKKRTTEMGKKAHNTSLSTKKMRNKRPQEK